MRRERRRPKRSGQISGAIDALSQRVARLDAMVAAIEPVDANTAVERVLRHFADQRLTVFSNAVVGLLEPAGADDTYGAMLLSASLDGKCRHASDEERWPVDGAVCSNDDSSTHGRSRGAGRAGVRQDADADVEPDREPRRPPGSR